MHFLVTLKYSSILLALIFLSSCSSENKPSSDEISKSIEGTLPGYLQLSGFDIDAQQNYGDEVNPRWVSTFIAELTAKDSLYVETRADNRVKFVSIRTELDSKTKVYGKVISTKYQGSWRNSVDYDGSPIQAAGKPRNLFDGRTVLATGSEFDDYQAELVAIEKARIETENKRRELARQQEILKQEEAKKRIAEENRVEQAKEDAKQKEHERILGLVNQTEKGNLSSFCFEELKKCSAFSSSKCITINGQDVGGFTNKYKTTITPEMAILRDNLAKNGLAVTVDVDKRYHVPQHAGCIDYSTTHIFHSKVHPGVNQYTAMCLKEYLGEDYYVNQGQCNRRLVGYGSGFLIHESK